MMINFGDSTSNILIDNSVVSDVMLISFTVHGKDRRIPIFTFYNILREIPVTKVFVANPKMHWYQNGIPEAGTETIGIPCMHHNLIRSLKEIVILKKFIITAASREQLNFDLTLYEKSQIFFRSAFHYRGVRLKRQLNKIKNSFSNMSLKISFR